MPQRVKTSVTSVQKARKNTLWIVFWIFIVHLAAIAQFTRGFLLTRQVLTNTSTEPAVSNPPFERAVILVVDALRHDFVVTPPGAPDLPYLRHFPLHDISSDPRHGFTVKFLADPPTTTLQRLKGLTTGSLPAFVDAGSNFAGFRIEEDNWVTQAANYLGPVSFVGDDTWEALFAQDFAEFYPFPSLNVRDLDTVDNGVKNRLPTLIQNSTNRVVIGHMLGVDHVGHRYGPNHASMRTKLDETFKFVSEIAAMIDDKTVLMVMGDHGMDQTGNHGGDSQDELEAALWVYSKQPRFESTGEHTVQQIDLVPTISGLLGLPIPFNSLGFPIRQAFGNDKDWASVSAKTKQQLELYTETVGLVSAKKAIKQLGGVSPREFQEVLLELFRDAWIQFDIRSMYKGIALMVLSIGASVLLYNAVLGPQFDMATVTKLQNIGALMGTVSGSLTNSDQLMDRNYLQFAISVAFHIGTGAIVLGVLPAVYNPNWTRPSKWTLASLVFLGVEVATGFSNSFVIWESRILHFLLATLFTLMALHCARTRSPLVMYLAAWYAAAIFAILRLSSSWTVCREETASRCSTTFFDPGSSLVPTWTLFAVGVLGLVLPYFLVRFWAIGKNDVGTAQLLLHMTSLAMTIVVAYWSLDNAEARGWIAHNAYGLQTGKLVLGRLGLTMGALGGLLLWWTNNVPIEIVVKNNRPEKIEGYNNVHGAYVLLTAVCLFWSLCITHKPPAILSMAGLLYICCAALDFIDVSESKYSLLVPLLYDMLSHSFFYFTGHQATIPSIQWDIAFVAARTVSVPWSQLTVMLNTLSPFLLCGLVAVFSALWRRPPFKNPLQPVKFTLRAAIGLSLVASVRALGSILAACLLRRHLMSWKIFAPRFMFGALALLAADAACIFAVILSGHTIKKVTEMFGHQ